MSKRIYLSPSEQTKNTYAYGNTNEAVQCGKIAEAARAALERNGFEVMLGHYMTMAQKCAESDAFGADAHIPIHTNACNGEVTGTRLFSYSLSGEGYELCKSIFNQLAPLTPGKSESISAQPQLYEVRTPKAPTAYIEVEFHDNAAAAQWIVEHTDEIGEAIARGVCDYFGVPFLKKEDARDNAPDAYAVEAINWAVDKGILKGDDTGNYMLHSEVTRQDMLVFLYRALCQ